MRRRVVFPALALVLSSTASFEAQQSTRKTLVMSDRMHPRTVTAIARDPDGSVWMVGQAEAGLPTTPDALSRTVNGSIDGYLQRIAPDGTLRYSSYLGGGAWETAQAVAVDAAGNVYVAGQTNSRDFPTTADALDTQMTGNTDVFLMKLTPGAGSVAFSTYLGGAGDDGARAMAVDAAGAIHLVGDAGPGFPVTPDAIRSAPTDSSEFSFDVFYTRLGTNPAALEYSTYVGGSERESPAGVAVDAAGNAYIVGWTDSRDFPLKNALQSSFGASRTGFLARFSRSGLDYSTFVGGWGYNMARGVAVSPTSVYVVGGWTSAFLTRFRLDGSAYMGSTVLDGSGDDVAVAVHAEANDVAYVAGTTHSQNFPVTPDAFQDTYGGGSGFAPNVASDMFFAIIPMTGASAGQATYSTYLGGSSNDGATAMAFDGTGGAWLAGDGPSLNFPMVNPKQNGDGTQVVAHFADGAAVPLPGGSEIVLYARDTRLVGHGWELRPDSTAAGGSRVYNPNAGIAKLAAASAAPSGYVEATFNADPGVPYHLWLRMKADNDLWTNDSVFVQFSDSVDAGGNAIWRIGTSDATSVSLEDCNGCGERGWGWNDNGYGKAGQSVIFATAGPHTLRIQQREDGISIDQIVLSRQTYASTAPGAQKDDTTIVPQSTGGTSEPPTPPPPPPPPPPSDPREIVMYVANERLAGGQNWVLTNDDTAAGGARLLNADAGQAKSSSPSASGSDYFDVQFTAEAGIAYHLWIRSQATNDHWTNDSAFVQFSDSVDASGNPVWRIGSDSATYVSLEDCSGCGEQGWGWNDNAYGGFAAPMYFAKSGPQTLRVLRREDGIAIDQIVLSAGKYLNASPGLAKNDTTIVPK
jgi:hypothetical protein